MGLHPHNRGDTLRRKDRGVTLGLRDRQVTPGPPRQDILLPRARQVTQGRREDTQPPRVVHHPHSKEPILTCQGRDLCCPKVQVRGTLGELQLLEPLPRLPCRAYLSKVEATRLWKALLKCLRWVKIYLK